MYSIGKRRYRFLFLVGLWSLFPIAWSLFPIVSFAQPATDNSDPLSNPKFNCVKQIRFEGNTTLNSEELSTAIGTKVPGFYDHFIHSVIPTLGFDYQPVDLDQLGRDTTDLKNYYKDHGFLQAHTDFRVIPDSAELRKYRIYLDSDRRYKLHARKTSLGVTPPTVEYTVVFTIREGNPSYIDGFTFEGLERLPEEFQPELTRNTLIKLKSRWSLDTAGREVDRLAAIMRENGYPFFRHDSILISFYPKSNNVKLNVIYSPGHRYRVGPIRVEYDTTAPEHSHVGESVIRAQLYVKEGTWFKQSDLIRSEQALYKLNAFEIVQMSIDTAAVRSIPDSLRDSTELPVVVNLRMRLRAELSPGLFGGTGARGVVLGATLAYSNRNFGGGADNLALSISYQFLPSTETRYSASVDYTIPYIGIPHVPLTIGVSAVQQSEANVFNEQIASVHFGSNISLSTLDNRTIFTPDITFQRVWTQALDPIKARRDSFEVALPKAQLNAIPSVSLQLDRSNDFLEPTAGYVFGASLEYGIPFTFAGLNSSNYVKAVPQFKFYTDLTNSGDAVIAAKIRIGYTYLFIPDSSDRLPPIDRRFYAGGPNSVRGWGGQSMIVSTDPNRDPIQGGYKLFEFSTELRLAPFHSASEYTTMQKLLSPLHVAIFFDAGNTWDKDVSFALGDLALAAGLGLRYHTLVGALRFDVGFKLYDPSCTRTSNNFITVPGSAGRWLWQPRPPGESFMNLLGLQFALGEPF